MCKVERWTWLQVPDGAVAVGLGLGLAVVLFVVGCLPDSSPLDILNGDTCVRVTSGAIVCEEVYASPADALAAPPLDDPNGVRGNRRYIIYNTGDEEALYLLDVVVAGP